MRIYLIALLLLLLQPSLQSKCNLGCLACQKTSQIDFECAVCDLFNSYALNELGICESNPIENCEIPSPDHTKKICIQCKSGYIMDYNVFKCVKIPDSSVVSNCVAYLGLNHCVTCESGYYIKDGLCTGVTTAIADCVNYNETGENCLDCANGKYLDAEGKCTVFETASDCLLYSKKQCSKCKSNHLKELNYFSSQTMTTSLAEHFILAKIKGEGKVIAPSERICIELNIAHCSVYKNFKSCAVCEDGYFLNAKRTCTINPSNEIAFCKYYTDKETCRECDENHYLVSNECIERTKVEFCVQHEISSNVCLKCDEQHYLVSNNNQCEKRNLSLEIEFCEDKTVDADTCERCKNRFHLTSDKFKCLFQIAHCIEYDTAQTGLLSESLVCQTCEENFYPDNNNGQVCHAQDVSNCKEFKTNSGVCETCDEGFYLNSTNNTCNPYNLSYCKTKKEGENKCEECINEFYNDNGVCKPYSVTNCNGFNTTADECLACIEQHYKKDNNCFKYNLVGCAEPEKEKNECIECSAEYYLDSSTKKCVKNNLSNCLLASKTANACLECSDGYYIDSTDNKCKLINVPNCKPNMINFTNSTCQSDGCLEGFFLNNDNHCIAPYLPYCKTYSSLDVCSECEEGYSLYNDICHNGTTPYCVSYTTDSVNCSECEFGYFLDSNLTPPRCLPQIADGCLEFVNKISLKCAVCQEGYLLETFPNADADSKFCRKFTVQNCETYVADKDECDTCIDGFYKDILSNSCLRITIPACTDVAITNGQIECSTCETTHVLTDEKTCILAENLLNCIQVDASNPEECSVCAPGFFVDSNASNTCSPVSEVSECLSYKIDADECAVCKDGYAGTTCTAVNFCLKTDGTNCTLCENGYYLDNNTCTAYTTTSLIFADTNCWGSIADNECLLCKDNFGLVSTSNVAFVKIENCETFDSDQNKLNKCIQCAKGYQLATDSDKDYKCVEGSTDMICLKKLPFSADKTAPVYPLNNATECEECYDKSKYFLLNNTCTTRKNFDNCEVFSESGTTADEDNCVACKKGYTMLDAATLNMSLPIYYGVCINFNKKGTSDITTTNGNITNCEVYDIAADGTLGKCLKCIPTAEPDNASDITSCDTAIDSSKNCKTYSYFDPTSGSFTNNFSTVTLDNNGTHCALKNDFTFGVASCSSGSLLSIGTLDLTVTGLGGTISDLSPRGSIDISTGDILFSETNLLPNTCELISGGNVLKSPGSNITTTTESLYSKNDLENCELGAKYIVSGPKTNLYCIKCKSGYDPQIIQVFKEGTDNANIMNAVKCVKASGAFIKKYQAYVNDFAVNKLVPTDLVNYDTCSDETKILVAYIKFYATTSIGFYWYIGTEQFNNHRALFCVDSDKTGTTVAGCQYYITESIKSTGTTLDTASTKCAMCKPGYKPDLTNNVITACNEITNCDLNNNNNVMNACQTCQSGFAHPIASDTGAIDLQACEAIKGNNTKDNCILFVQDKASSAGSEIDFCVLCKEGFNLVVTNDDIKCIPINENENNCVKYGKRLNLFANTSALTNHSTATAFNTAYASFSNGVKYYFSLYLNWQYRNSTNSNSYGCVGCDKYVDSSNAEKTAVPLGRKLDITDNAFDVCVNILNTEFNAVENCKLHSFDKTASKCYECEDGYVLTDTDTCIPSFPFTENAQKYDTSNKANLICKKGYILISGKCLSTENCKINNATSGNCDLCEDFYYKDFDTLSKCLPLPQDHPCQSFALKFCIKCKNGKIPYTVPTTDNIIPTVICSYNGYDSIYTGFKTSIERADFFSLDSSVTYFDTASNTDLLPTLNKVGINQIANVSSTISFRANYCTSLPYIENCSNYNRTTFKCDKCNDGFFTQNGYECIQGEIHNCFIFLDTKTCKICANGYYNNLGKCLPYTVQNCAHRSIASDKCIECASGYYLDDNLECQKDKSRHCMNHNPYGGYCLQCEYNYKLNDNGNCEAISNPGCLYIDMNDGKCILCEDDYYLSSGLCQRVSSGCLISHSSYDICFKCKEEYFINETICNLRKNTDCLLFAPYNDGCITCHPGSYMKDGKCFKYTIENCSIYNPNSDGCLDCQENYQLTNDFKCTASSDPGCIKPSRYEGGCIQCENTYYLDENAKQCKSYSVKCKHYHPYKDLCLSCHEGQYLASGLCTVNKAQNCSEKSVTDNVCLSCIDGYYIDSNGNCKIYQVQNCEIYSSYADRCFKCNAGFYLDSDLQCKNYSFSACDIYDTHSDACLRCNPNFYVGEDRKCYQRHSEGCNGVALNADRCLGCNPGYYLQNGLCHVYSQQYCYVFEPNSDSCISCLPSAYKVGGDCIPYKKTNCLTYHKDLDGCTSCHKGEYLDNYSCFEYDLDYCEEYHPNDNLCLKCEKGPWYRNGHGKCANITPVDNCEKYKDYFDECEECELGYFLEDQKCVANPSGVTHCVEYLNDVACARCEVPYYVKENQCLKSDTLIPKCAYYSYNGSCSRCEQGFFLEANKCVETTNNTCLTYLNKDNCASCGENKVLDPTGSQIRCVDSDIENCIKAEYVSEGAKVDPNADPVPPKTYYQCTLCKSGHYLSFNTCIEVSSIQNCSYYESDTLCSECASGYTLSVDKQTCSENAGLGSGCDIGKELSTPQCSVCQEGFLLNETGLCVKCAVDGCSICDVLNPRKCKLCQEGYHMNELFYCLKISDSQSQEQGYDDILIGTELQKVEGSTIFSFSLVSLIISLFIKE